MSSHPEDMVEEGSQRLRFTSGSALSRSRWNNMGAAILPAVVFWFCANSLGLLTMVPFIGGRPGSMLYVLLAGVVLGATRLHRLPLVGATVLLVLWLVVCFTPVAAYLAIPLRTVTPDVSLRSSRADAVVVLAADIQKDNEFDSVSQARFLGGLEVVRRGLAPTLVLTELNPPSGSHLTAAQNLTDRLKIDCPIKTVGPIRNTHDEAVAVAKLADELGWKTIILVTSPTHSRRASMVFRHAGRAHNWQVFSFPCHESNYDLENLPRPSDRLQAFSSAIHEIVGIAVYRVHGWV